MKTNILQKYTNYKISKNHAFTKERTVIEVKHVFFTFLVGIFMKDIFLLDFARGSSTRKIRILEQVLKIHIFLY